MTIQVFTLAIDHRHGTDTSVHASEAEALACLDEYVQENWDYEFNRNADTDEIDGGEEMPDTPEGRLVYFERMVELGDPESYEIGTHQLTLPDMPQEVKP